MYRTKTFIHRMAMMLLLMVLTAATAWAEDEGYDYFTADGAKRNTFTDDGIPDDAVHVLTDEGFSLEEGWNTYFGASNPSTGNLSIHDEVFLILYRVYFTGNIAIESGGSLTIYNNDVNRGFIDVTKIGGYISVSEGSSLTVNGGNILADVSVDSGGSFTVNRGSVTTSGSGDISVTDGGSFIVNGGTVKAGSCGGNGNLTLNGGTVTVSSSCLSDVTLAGGTITAGSYEGKITIADGWTYTDGTNIFNPGTIINEPEGDTTYQPKWEGSGTSDSDPILIKTTNDLDLLAKRVNSGNDFSGTYFKLTNDIMYNIKYKNYKESIEDEYEVHESNYTAIGGKDKPFCGSFDGANHAISGIRIYRTDTEDADSYQGIFGLVGSGGTVENVILDESRIACYKNVGCIVGENAGTVENCHVLHDIWFIANTAGADCHGGIAGSNSGSVTRCSSEAQGQLRDDNLKNHGGIVGSNGGTVSDCISSLSGTGSSNFGAIVGYNTGSVTGSYFTSTVASGRDNEGHTLYGDDRAVGYSEGGTVTDCGIAPQDTKDNSHFLTLMAQRTYALTAVARPWPFDTGMNNSLNGRTFYKDGKWNTLCLPFSFRAELIAKQPDFAGATLMEIDTEGKNGFDPTDGTLYLTFKEATEIRAGVPYLVKWDDEGTTFTSPSFEPVTIGADFDATATPTVTCSSPTAVTSNDGTVTFVGTYSPVPFASEDRSILFMGGNNNLYYPDGTSPITIGAFRAYFTLDGITAGDPSDPSSPVKAFVLNFGEEDADGIGEIQNSKFKIQNSK